MYIFWFVLALIMGIVYWYLEIIVWFAFVRKFTSGKKYLRGKKNYYIWATTVIVFTGISSFYFSIIDFTQSPFSFGCWIIPAILFSVVAGITKASELKQVPFHDE